MAFNLIPGDVVAIGPKDPAALKPSFPVDPFVPPATPVPTPTPPVPAPAAKPKPSLTPTPDLSALTARIEALLAASQAAQQQPPQAVPSLGSLAQPSAAVSAKDKPFAVPTEPDWPPPGPPGTPLPPVVPRITEDQFKQLYRDWLGRDPKAGEYDQYGNDEFSKIKQWVVTGKEHTDRWNGQVNAWYRQFKGRDATAAELAALRGKYLENIQGALKEIQTGAPGGTTPWKPGDPLKPLPTDVAGWFMGLVQGKPPTPASLIAMENLLNSYGIKVLRNAEGVAGKIQLPNGKIIDVIIAAGLGGRGWQWDDSAGGGGTGGAAPTPPLPGVPGVPLDTVPAQFNDPYTKQLEDYLSFRINELFQPVDDPFRQQYAQMLQLRTDELAAGNAEVKALTDFLNKRFKELQEPEYTGAEKEIIRTSALDPIERDRQAAQRRALEDISARGMTPDSGLAQELQALVDAGFDSSRAQAQRDIALNEMSRRDARLAEAGQVGASVVDVRDARAREALDTANALFGVSTGVRNEEQNRRQEALSLIGMLADLPTQALKTALMTLGQGEQPGDIMGSLLSIAGLNQRQGQINTQNSGSFWSGLGTLARLLQQSGIGSGGGGTWAETRGTQTTYVPR